MSESIECDRLRFGLRLGGPEEVLRLIMNLSLARRLFAEDASQVRGFLACFGGGICRQSGDFIKNNVSSECPKENVVFLSYSRSDQQ